MNLVGLPSQGPSEMLFADRPPRMCLSWKTLPHNSNIAPTNTWEPYHHLPGASPLIHLVKLCKLYFCLHTKLRSQLFRCWWDGPWLNMQGFVDWILFYFYGKWFSTWEVKDRASSHSITQCNKRMQSVYKKSTGCFCIPPLLFQWMMESGTVCCVKILIYIRGSQPSLNQRPTSICYLNDK